MNNSPVHLQETSHDKVACKHIPFPRCVPKLFPKALLFVAFSKVISQLNCYSFLASPIDKDVDRNLKVAVVYRSFWRVP